MIFKKTGLSFFLLFSCLTGLAIGSLDDFESYAIDTVLDGVNGWAIYNSLNSNSNSPIIKDNTAGYVQINGKFLKFVDNNLNGNTSEMIAKDSQCVLSRDGEYVQLAMYLSSESVEGATPAGGLECRVLQGTATVMRFGMSWDYSSDNLAHWYYNDGTEHHTNFPGTINNPCSDANRPMLDRWYILRATLRDVDEDGVVDSYDLETFDENMNLMWSESGITTLGRTVCEKVVIGTTSASAKSVGLIDEIQFNKSIVNYLRPSGTTVVDDFESYNLLTSMEGTGGWTNGWYGLNSNLSSPVIKDGSTSSYPEFNGNFMQMIDDNSRAVQSEVIVKTFSKSVSEPGDYIQMAIYMSSENPFGTLGGYFECRIFEGTSYMIRCGGRFNNRTGNIAHWFYQTVSGEHSTYSPATIINPCPEEQRPRLNEWYIIRITLRDADDNGIVDSYDFETFDAYMKPLWYELGIETYNGEMNAVCESIMFILGGSSNTAIGLVDEILTARYSDAPPANCVEVWAKGFGLHGDLNKDCRVDVEGDLLPVITGWLLCNDPENSNCTPNW
ncbi:MAG TPA: hypothetical protein DDX75_01880 [Phycisphaerales bacterium]|nr:hypothetical protein [Phycisphaerales bacterium]